MPEPESPGAIRSIALVASDQPRESPEPGATHDTRLSREERAEISAAVRETLERSQAIQRRLREVGASLPTLEEQASATVAAALDTFGAVAAIAARLIGDERSGHLVLEGTARVPREVYAGFEIIPVVADLPLAVAARTANVVVCETRSAIAERFPAMTPMVDALGAHSICTVPVLHRGRTRGALSLLFDKPRYFSAVERARVRAMGARYARALHHGRQLFAERDARWQAEQARTEAELARREAELARSALEEAHVALEARIAERTAELASVNATLTGEIDERARLDEERLALRRQLASAEEDERRRLARELHDQLGQHLTALTLGLAEVAKMLPADSLAQRRLAVLQSLTEDITRDARHLALELHPPELDDVGLASALRTYVAQWSERYGTDVEFEMTGLTEVPVPTEVATTIYRIVQEALTNIAKHAHATHVSVLVERVEGEMRLIVEDDGLGFEVERTIARATRERRLGVAGMHERAALVGGAVTIESSRGSGTTVYVRLPVARDAPWGGRSDA